MAKIVHVTKIAILIFEPGRRALTFKTATVDRLVAVRTADYKGYYPFIIVYIIKFAFS